MPELPEVETIVRQLRARGIEGRCILSVRIQWHRTVEPLSPAVFTELVTGTTMERINRVGKWIVITLDSGKALLIHLRMSGSFSMLPGSHDRIVMELSEGLTLHYHDTRKFGRWKVVDDPFEILGSLGPDALSRSFSVRYFSETVRNRRRAVKAMLLDQSIVAGLGNIYVDEALWEAGIHPERPSGSLSEEEVGMLFRAIKNVLKIGVRNRGTSLGVGRTNYRDLDGESGGHRAVVKAYGRTGLPCERCGADIVKINSAQRGTHICPECQQIPSGN